MLKKLLATSLILSMMFSANLVTYAANSDTKSDAIIEQALALNDELDLCVEDVVIVTRGGNFNTRAASEGEQVIQAVETVEGVTAVTTIIPLTISESGELVNSFECEETQTGWNFGYTPAFPSYVDFTFTYVAYYTNLSTGGRSLYRHVGLEATWNKSDASADVSVDNMYVRYQSTGNLYDYPALSNCSDTEYTVTSTVNVSNPEAGRYYFDTDDAMASNQVLYLLNPSDGGNVIYSIVYTYGGSTGSYDDYVGETIFDIEGDYGTH